MNRVTAKKHRPGSLLLLLAALFIIFLVQGCSFSPVSGGSPTPTSPTGPQGNPDFLGAITVDEGSVSIFNSGSLVRTLSKGEVANLQANDLVTQDNNARQHHPLLRSTSMWSCCAAPR